MPPLTEGARQRRTSGDYARPTSDQAAREDDPGFEGPEAYNDPEIRPLAERCLVGFSSTSGPPILPTYFYNNLSIRKSILDAASRKAATIEKLGLGYAPVNRGVS